MNSRLPETHQNVQLAIHQADFATIHHAASIARYSVSDFCELAVYLLARQTVAECQFPPVGCGHSPVANDRAKKPF